MKKIKHIIILGAIIIILILPYFVFAANPTLNRLKNVGDMAGYATEGESNALGNIIDVVAIVIEIILGMLGLIFLVLMILAGLKWMTAQGDEQKVKQAQQSIQRAIIGLIIILCSYGFTYFIFNKLPFNINTDTAVMTSP